MKLKSFFADSIEEAISAARREMGPEAMLVHSKRSSAESQHLGAYEVVCASETEPAESNQRSAANASIDGLIREVSEVKQQMERLARSLARCGGGIASLASAPDLAAVVAALTEAELDAALIYELMGALSSPLRAGALREQARQLIRVDASIGQAPHNIAALVGPPGSGKTSALVKLAIQYGIAARKRVRLVTLDTYRIAAAEQLQAYAAIAAIPCQVLDNPAALSQTLAGQTDLVLIDTPGLGRNEMDENLASALVQVQNLDVHLVLPASMRSRDLTRAADQYAIFHPKKLLFTRLDETETFGPLVSLSARMNLPLSFLSSGQRIPEDLLEATPDLLAGLLVPGEQGFTEQVGTVAA